MRTIQNTLYIMMTQNTYLHRENDTLRVDVERKKKLQVNNRQTHRFPNPMATSYNPVPDSPLSSSWRKQK